MKETVGQVASHLRAKAREDDHTVHDQMQAQLADYEKNVIEAFERGKKEIDGNFYVVVLLKREQLMPNVIRTYYFPRKSCPTPTFDQVVYQVTMPEEEIKLLWTLPNGEICSEVKSDPFILGPEEKDLRYYILSFYDGTLDTICLQHNQGA